MIRERNAVRRRSCGVKAEAETSSLPLPLLDMATILVCLALIVTPWSAATPIQSSALFNITGESLQRTKRWCHNHGSSYNVWPGCSSYNYHWQCYDPCLVWPTARPTYPPHTRPPTGPTRPWTVWPTQTPRPTYTPVWPTWTPRPTQPPYTPVWPTWWPSSTRPPYTPIMPTVRPPYTPIMPTVRPPYTPIMPTVRPPYTPIMPTVRPPYTPIMPTVRPPYTPIMPTVSPIPTRPPYTPIWPTWRPSSTRPPYTPIMPTVRPPYTPIMPTVRPPYTPIMPTVSPTPTRPPYTPIWPTWRPSSTRPPYTPIMPTVRPPYTPIMPTVRPTPTRPPYTPIMPTVRPTPTRPAYTPIWPTWRPSSTRPPYTPIMPTRTPYPTYPTVTNARTRRCNKLCAYEHKMYYCCDTTTIAESTTTPMTSRGTCPAQTSPCRKSAKRRTKRECMFDYQCPDDHSCCYDNCLQEYKCLRHVPKDSNAAIAQLVLTERQHPHRHHHEDETRVERSTHFDGHEKTPSSGSLANDTKVPTAVVTRGQRYGAGTVEVVVMIDEERQDSTQALQHLLESLAYLPHPQIYMSFLPLHPPDGSRTAMWEAVQCAERAAPEHRPALNLVACVLAAAPSLSSQPNSFLLSVRECGSELEVNWSTLQTCMSHGKGGSLLRGALLRHSRLLETARKKQLSGKQPAAAVLAVNGTLVEGAAAAAAIATNLLGHSDSAPSSGVTA